DRERGAEQEVREGNEEDEERGQAEAQALREPALVPQPPGVEAEAAAGQRRFRELEREREPAPERAQEGAEERHETEQEDDRHDREEVERGLQRLSDLPADPGRAVFDVAAEARLGPPRDLVEEGSGEQEGEGEAERRSGGEDSHAEREREQEVEPG